MSESVRNVHKRNHTLRTFVINSLIHIQKVKISVEIAANIASVKQA